MRFWPRRRTRASSPEESGQYWEDDPHPLQAYFGSLGGPRFLEQRGPARIYDDEIDEDWHDPWTDDRDEDDD